MAASTDCDSVTERVRYGRSCFWQISSKNVPAGRTGIVNTIVGSMSVLERNLKQSKDKPGSVFHS